MPKEIAARTFINNEKSKCTSSILCQFSVRAGKAYECSITLKHLTALERKRKNKEERHRLLRSLLMRLNMGAKRISVPDVLGDLVMDRSELGKILDIRCVIFHWCS